MTHSDTLFIAGCGRFFEGTPTEMHAALTKLGGLPDDTVVYNGHEYTAASVKFGLKIEPDNADLKRFVPPFLPSVPIVIDIVVTISVLSPFSGLTAKGASTPM